MKVKPAVQILNDQKRERVTMGMGDSHEPYENGKQANRPCWCMDQSHHLEHGIVKELTARKRNRLFSDAGVMEIMSRGTELPERQHDAIPSAAERAFGNPSDRC